MNYFMDEFDERDGAWVLVDPHNLEPTGENPVSGGQPGTSQNETATSDPVDKSTSLRKSHGFMHMQDPEGEGVTIPQKRKILKAVYSHKYRLTQIAKIDALKEENKVLKQELVDSQNRKNALIMSIRHKLNLIETLRMRLSAVNDFESRNSIF